MKFYVITKFKPFGEEIFVRAFQAKSRKELLKELGDTFPNFRGSIEKNDLTSDPNKTWFISVKEYSIK